MIESRRCGSIIFWRVVRLTTGLLLLGCATHLQDIRPGDSTAGAGADSQSPAKAGNAEAQQIDHEVRSSLPVGTSRGDVERFLRERRLYDGADSRRRILYGGASLKEADNSSQFLLMKFHFDKDSELPFDDSSVLTSIESDIVFPVPGIFGR
jgi:hypothetical protein